MKKLTTILIVAMFALSACSSDKANKMADNVNEKAEDTKDDAVENTEEAAEETAEETADDAMTVDVVDTLVKEGNFTTLVAALNAAELADDLKGEGPFTVMAPTDEAFSKLPAGTVEEWLKPENKDKLASVLKYHVVPAKKMAADIETMDAPTLHGGNAKVVKNEEDGSVTFAGAQVTRTDIEATNGIIHVIDTVVMPPKEDATASK